MNYEVKLAKYIYIVESIDMEEVVFDLQLLFREENCVSHRHLLLLLCDHTVNGFLSRSGGSILGRRSHSIHHHHLECYRDAKVRTDSVHIVSFSIGRRRNSEGS